MPEQHLATTPQTWSHRWTFVLAAAGSAIGLGNLWKFPYMTGMNGGGAFVCVYLVCLALVGIPVMMAEAVLGRHGRSSPVSCMRELAHSSGASKHWGLVAVMGVLSGFLILSFYSVVAGWGMAYTLDMISGTFRGMNFDQVSDHFHTLTSDPLKLTIWHTLFIVLSGIVIGRGVHKGLENSVRIMMPALLGLLLILLGYSALESGHFAEGVRFMFSFKPEQLTRQAVLSALGHAFFTLSLGMGSIMAYGAYMPKKASIARTVSLVVLLDTIVALAAGLAIFPLVFALNMDADFGPGLLFVSLTSAFAKLPGGSMGGTLFFLMVCMAALSSSVSMVEPAVAWLTEKTRFSRASVTLGYCVLVWCVGMGSVLSFNEWSGEEFQLAGMTFFEWMDFLTANITLPVGGLLISIFAGWIVQRSIIYKEFNLHAYGFNLWRAMVRVVAPVVIFVVFYSNLAE